MKYSLNSKAKFGETSTGPDFVIGQDYPKLQDYHTGLPKKVLRRNFLVRSTGIIVKAKART